MSLLQGPGKVITIEQSALQCSSSRKGSGTKLKILVIAAYSWTSIKPFVSPPFLVATLPIAHILPMNHSLPIRDGNMAVYSIVSGKFSQFYNGFHKLNPPWLTLNSYYNNILFFFFSKNDTNDCLKWQKHSGVSIETNQRSKIKIIMTMLLQT